MASRVSSRRLWPVLGFGLGVMWAVGVVYAERGAAASAITSQASDVTVRGCVMKDAASRVPFYKLLEDPPGTRVFRLTFPKDIDVPSQVGHTVEVTGSVVAGGAQSHDPDLTVKKLTPVRESCSVPVQPAHHLSAARQ